MYTLKKSLGQHFLKDENIIKRIIAALQQCSFEKLLEIGPGAGALTRYLQQISGIDFKAVELDAEKVDYLLAQFPGLTEKIIHKNFLEIDKPFEGKFAVVGNFPYNISTQILFKILEWKNDITCVVGMFQKEVAQRIAAKEGTKIYGISSVLTQAFFDVEYLFEVSEGSFQPPPKVKSAVIRLTPKHKYLSIKSEERFFMLVKSAFNQRRKTLRNAVRRLFDEETLRQKIFDKRAEQLKLEDFADLSFKMQP
ncbi:MAG TPA: 16S rRNA (adenine(1518)-N(6)/adenine(1519)-N(6))-dimethyltransferase RsmA [Chitinophagaceae bacterium]|nr:16S rRNA (adenine(1518)-N(6)/adenine(1519)-N(6))-dimethyltransferase RsmA [Chitinophagaceae bacterium]